MKTKLQVWRNPDPIQRHRNDVRKYNELLRLHNEKWKELESITKQMRECANLIYLNVIDLEKYVK